jgi:hypothetical protein
MTLEWLRRHDSALDGFLRTYLFTDRPIVEEEREVEGGGGDGAAPVAARSDEGSLRIGSLKGR